MDSVQPGWPGVSGFNAAVVVFMETSVNLPTKARSSPGWN